MNLLNYVPEMIDEKMPPDKNFFRSLVWHLPIFISSLDASGTVPFWSPYQEKLLGYTAEEAIGKLTPYMLHETKEEADDVFRIASEKGICDVETTFVHKNGSIIPVHLVAMIYKDQSGNIIGNYGFALDISERKRAEKALKESEKELHVLYAKLLSLQEDEKKRISRELHDSIEQTLEAIKIAIQNIFKEMEEAKESPMGSSFNKTIATMIDSAIEVTRKITVDRRPAVVDDLDIVPTITWFFKKFQELQPSPPIEENKKANERGKQLPWEERKRYDENLTVREREVLKLIAEGKSNKEISELLCISLHTVENHRANIRKKLQIKKVTDLVKYAIRKGYASYMASGPDEKP